MNKDKIKQFIEQCYKQHEVQNGQTPKRSYFIWSKKISSRDVVSLIKAVQEKQQTIDKISQIELNLFNNKVGGVGCKQISKIQMTHLSILNLSNNGVGDEGCRHLKKGNWPDLKQLYLWGNKITEKGSIDLSKANWDALEQIDLGFNPIGKRGFISLRTRFIKCTINCYAQYQKYY